MTFSAFGRAVLDRYGKMKYGSDQLLEIARYSMVRLDGAWFLAIAKKFGTEAAWETDVEAWKQFSYVLGKRIGRDLIPEPVWPDSFLEALEILSHILMIGGREVTLDGNRIIITVTDCEVQKAIAKAGVADCGIVTVHTYQGLMNGLFGKAMDVRVEHTRNLNRGDDRCEVVITPS